MDKSDSNIPKSEWELNMVVRKTWSEFRNTGLLLFVNHFLHIFGWAIVLKFDKNEIVEVYPARVRYRGFGPDSYDRAYRNLSDYMVNNVEQLREEAYE